MTSLPSIVAAHARPASEVLKQLRSGPQGLTSTEAAKRLREHGRNAFPHARPPGILRVVLRQFAGALIYVLLVAAVVSAAMGDWSDAGFIVVVLVLNASIGAFQEYRAERSAEALRALVVPHAFVLRDGAETEIDAEELVPGDVVVLASGAKVPADLLLISGGLEVDESLLTGESVAVSKAPGASVPEKAMLAERPTMVFAGTIVTRGRAHGVAVVTGLGSELGKIASSLTAADTVKPPLLERMERFTKKIAFAVGGSVIVLGAISYWRGASLHEVFLASVALAVSAIPEGLPVAMTVALAIAVRRMSHRKVIVRRLAAVESLGSCTFIASDKTGTLTMNELTARRVQLPGRKTWEVADEVPGAAGSDHDRKDLERVALAATLCNDGTFAESNGTFTSHGDAVDVALLVLAAKLGIFRARAEQEHPRTDALPFEAERQFAATANRFPSGTRLFVKGAGERVIAMCSRMASPSGDVPLDRAQVESEADALAAAGYRVLAIAESANGTDSGGPLDASALRELVLLGFVGMIDPLRPEAKAAIDACHNAGIEVAMVTGDHPVTAYAIASELGLAGSKELVVTGPALRSAAIQGEKAFDAVVARSRVFARVEPQQKLAIVQSLIRAGHFVAVTGDGANDAPAMRVAHLGVAMGKRGTDIARETGELILTDDNFASIVAGVEEGRVAYGNVRKVIFLLISCGAAELTLFFLAIVTGMPLPLFAAQLLWMNLVTNGIQDVALAFEPGEGGELDRPPRSPREPIFDWVMIERVFVSALVMGGISFAVFRWLLQAGWSLDDARNAVVLLMVLFQNIQAGNARSERRSLLTLSPFRNRLLLAGTLAAQLTHIGAMYTPGLRDLLRIHPVSIKVWLSLLAIALTLFAVMEIEKLIRRIRDRRAFGRRL